MFSEEVAELAKRVDEATEALGSTVDGYVNKYLDLCVIAGTLTREEAERGFRYIETIEGRGLVFESESWDEYWNYGGHESHPREDIVIPFEFFDDQKKYADEAIAKKKKKESDAKKAEAKKKADKVRRLKRELKELEDGI